MAELGSKAPRAEKEKRGEIDTEQRLGLKSGDLEQPQDAREWE